MTLSDADWTRVQEFHAQHQRAERDKLLCRRGIVKRIREAAKETRVRTPPMVRTKNAEDYIRETFGEVA